jgi:hypothetical protein
MEIATVRLVLYPVLLAPQYPNLREAVIVALAVRFRDQDLTVYISVASFCAHSNILNLTGR